MISVLLWSALLLGSTVADAAPANTNNGVRRLALLVGVNDGGPERTRLRYAATDAQSFSQVLGELGGVAPSDRVLLLETGRAGLLEGFERMKRLVASSKASGASRVEVLLYYSGHSDETGLLLQGERLTYGELRRALEGLPADVRIAVLDSCASGAFARRKGGSPRPAFLVDAGSRVTGQAILTSSSEDEASQESDRLGGSFFTHHLISGLRGAADMTRDGRVTLNEAYQFAFHETLSRTERTQRGAQHPAYDIELAGTGDLVMTDLRATSAALVLTDSLEGRLFVRDEAGRLVVEVMKVAGRSTELGLAPGRYRVRREVDGGLSEASFVLAEGRSTQLVTASFSSVLGEATVSRGGPVEEVKEAVPGRRRLAFNFGIAPAVSSNDWFARGAEVENGWAFGFMNHAAALKGGVSLSVLSNGYGDESDGALVTAGVNVVGGGMRGAQVSSILNVTGREQRGVQLTGGVNVAGGDMRGTQVSSILNVTGREQRGVQLTGGMNLAGGSMVGGQIAGAVNTVGGTMSGFQVSGAVNQARSVSGLQLSLVNVGGDVSGAQVGIVNVGKVVRGAQVGLINVAEEVHGAPVGLLSFVKQGQFHLELWSSDIHLTNVGVKLGGRHVYSTFVGGIDPTQRLQSFTLGFGLGVHIPLGTTRFWVDVDAVGHSVYLLRDPLEGNNLLAQARAMVGFQILPRLAVFAAPTYNVYFAFSPEERRDMTRFTPRELSLGGGGSMQYWPGIQLGLRI
ncbi:peptidase [Cystobacter ferrugineus]|uniref:Peptidase n=2 Tax=Cystobacter ferrugineus TaxID=83449 RepID=A0A1L9B0E6_9BACT|nr:peptidase [Cystobacter ferrugineus]